MRVLITDGSDDTVMVVDVSSVCYDSTEGEICLIGTDTDDTCYHTKMNYSMYGTFVRELYQNGKVDLSSYKFAIDLDDDEEE